MEARHRRAAQGRRAAPDLHRRRGHAAPRPARADLVRRRPRPHLRPEHQRPAHRAPAVHADPGGLGPQPHPGHRGLEPARASRRHQRRDGLEADHPRHRERDVGRRACDHEHDADAAQPRSRRGDHRLPLQPRHPHLRHERHDLLGRRLRRHRRQPRRDPRGRDGAAAHPRARPRRRTRHALPVVHADRVLPALAGRARDRGQALQRR